MSKITNHANDKGKTSKSLKESREGGSTNTVNARV